jgi:hypothetical protein
MVNHNSTEFSINPKRLALTEKEADIRAELSGTE